MAACALRCQQVWEVLDAAALPIKLENTAEFIRRAGAELWGIALEADAIWGASGLAGSWLTG